MLNLLARETNRYYQQQGNHNETKKDEATDVVEMKKFFGLIIIMGLVKKSDKDEYWFTNPVLRTAIFGNTMTKNRFHEISKYCHFSDNEHIY